MNADAISDYGMILNCTLQKLQAAHPGLYPDGLPRTVQRRVKIWRAERAHEMVFGALSDASSQVVSRMVESE